MLRSGDILFRKVPYHHTMMVMDPKEFALSTWYKDAQVVEIVHAASRDSHVYREDVDIEKEDVIGHWTGYRADDDTAARSAFGYANVWAWTRTSKSNEKLVTKRLKAKAMTPYSYKGGEEIATGRFYGMTEARIENVNPEFGFDALYRAVKWANRGREAFSPNRGTTCCAFITACHQAAVIDTIASGKFQRVKLAFDFISECRGDKDPDRYKKFVEQGEKKIAIGALRRSNPGPKWKEFSVDDYCREVTFILCKKRLSVEETFPPALIVDAKYNYSANFEKMLGLPRSGFAKIF